MKLPDDSLQWEKSLKKWQKKMKVKKMQYIKAWFVRARFATRWMVKAQQLKKKGKKKVAFPLNSFSSRRFMKLLPDSGRWTIRMTPRGSYLVKDLLEHLRFHISAPTQPRPSAPASLACPSIYLVGDNR